MAGKKKPKITTKRVAKEVGIGVRVCCSNVRFEPSEQQKADGYDQLLGKAEGTIVDFDVKSKKWCVKFDKMAGMQLFAKRNMTVLDFVVKEVRSKMKNNVVLTQKKTPSSAVVVDQGGGGLLTLTQMERDCQESGTPTATPFVGVTRKAPPTTPPQVITTKRPHLASPEAESPICSPPAAVTHARRPTDEPRAQGSPPGTQQSTPTPRTANTSSHSTPASRDVPNDTNRASLALTQEAEVLDGSGPVEYNIEVATPARVLQHLKTTGLDPSEYSDEKTESVETAETFQLRDVEPAEDVEEFPNNDDDLGYETDDTVQTNGEAAAADDSMTDDTVQFPKDLEVFIDQNSDAAPPPIIGQRLTFHDLEENVLDSEIHLRSKMARERAMAEEAVLEVDELADEVLRWHPIAKSVPENEDNLDFDELGVRGVKFNSSDFNPLDYFILMFPGDWRLKLHQLNIRIEKERIRKMEENKLRKLRERGDYMEKCSEDEFFRFIGIIIASSLHRLGGKPLWSTKGTETCSAANFGT